MFGNLVESQPGEFWSIARVWAQPQQEDAHTGSGLAFYNAEIDQDRRFHHTALRPIQFGPGVAERYRNRSLLEDPRLKKMNGRDIAILQGADLKIKLAELSADHTTIEAVRECRIEGVGDQKAKNVSPLVQGEQLFLVWMMDPLVITVCSDFCATACTVVTGSQNLKWLAQSKMRVLRGGSDWVPVPQYPDYYFSLGHSRVHAGTCKYLHRPIPALLYLPTNFSKARMVDVGEPLTVLGGAEDDLGNCVYDPVNVLKWQGDNLIFSASVDNLLQVVTQVDDALPWATARIRTHVAMLHGSEGGEKEAWRRRDQAESKGHFYFDDKVRAAHKPEMFGALDHNFSRWLRLFSPDHKEVLDMGGLLEDRRLGPDQGVDQFGLGDFTGRRRSVRFPEVLGTAKEPAAESLYSALAGGKPRQKFSSALLAKKERRI